MGTEAVDRAVIQVPGEHAAAGPVIGIHQQVQRDIFDEEFGVMLQRLLIERMQHGMAGPVGRRAGPLRLALAEARGHAAEGALIDLAILGAGKGQAVMLELDDRGHSLAHHIFDGVLIAQPVRPFHGVVHVPAPIVLAHIAERGGDAALSCDGVAAGREDLGDDGGLQPGFHHADGGPQAGPAGADDHDVIFMFDNRIRRHAINPRRRRAAR